MRRFIENHCPQLLCALAGSLLAVSAGWTWQQQANVRQLKRLPVAVEFSGMRYELPGLRSPESTTAVWPEAPAQSRGDGWVYEVFTPPVVCYDPLTRALTVASPLHPPGAGTPFDLELLEVKPEPYRLQLVGYVGEPGGYLAAFVSSSLPETLFARAGSRLERLGLTLQCFEVKKSVARAVLLDENTGAEVVLDSRTRKLTDLPLAGFKRPGLAQPCVLHEGDTLTDDTSSYRIERIQLDPPEVAVTKQVTGLALAETRMLHPVATNDGVTGKAAQPKSFSDRPTAGLVINGN